MIKTLYSNNSLGQIQQCVWSTCVFMCVFNCDDDATIFFTINVNSSSGVVSLFLQQRKPNRILVTRLQEF